MAGYARAFIMRDSTVLINAVEYNNQLTKVNFVPDTPMEQMPVLTPTGTITDIGTTTWTCELTGVQDNGSGSLGAVLRSSAGTLLSVVFQPRIGTGQDMITASVMAMPIAFGGEQGSWRTFDITLPVDGQPVFAQST
jgi:hypothetical protein